MINYAEGFSLAEMGLRYESHADPVVESRIGLRTLPADAVGVRFPSTHGHPRSPTIIA